MYSIKDLEELTGIKAHTIRIWEQRYDLLRPERSETNIRYYCDNQLKKVLNIAQLYKHGWKISHISKLTEDDIRQEVSRINDIPSNDVRVDNLVRATIEFNETAFLNILTETQKDLDFNEMMVQVIFPYYDKIGVLWQTDTLSPAQEHFASNLIRNELILATRKLPPSDHKLKAVAFLHQEEMHEIGLLTANYVMRKMGMEVIYLGQILPNDDLKFIQEKLNPDLIFTAFIKSNDAEWFNSYTQDLLDNFPNALVAIGGNENRKVTIEDEKLVLLKKQSDLENLIKSRLLEKI